MAVTNPVDIDTAVPEIWAKLTFRDHKAAGFWGKFTGGEGSGMPLIQVSELLNRPGDLIHAQITNPLTGAGQSGDTATLQGNEEKLLTTQLLISPLYRRHAVLLNRRAVKKSIVDLRSEARMRLAEWGMVKMDTERFTNFTATALPSPLNAEAYTPNDFVVGHPAGTATNLVVADTLTVAAIQQVKVALMLAHAKPIMMDGHPIYVLVTHPYALYGLKRDAEYRDFVKDAADRGKTNPFFIGATAMVDGVVLYEHERIPLATNAGSVQYAKGLAFGGEAFVEGLDENPDWDEDVFDYGLQFGMAYGFASQPRRALELSSTQVLSVATAVGT